MIQLLKVLELVSPEKRVLVTWIIDVFYTFGEILLAILAHSFNNWRYLAITSIIATLPFLSFSL
jgi:hypothetical protein